MTKPLLLGLPGLYRNWLSAALDPESTFSLDLEHNFLCKKSRYQSLDKNDIDFGTTTFPTDTINLYVNDQNFVWFLYNFLEKTDGVGISVDSLIEDLEIKAPGTKAFNFMLEHFFKTYDIPDYQDYQYRKNAAIEYFYFLLLDQNTFFKTQSMFTDPSFLNVEYAEFENRDLLKSKFLKLEQFDVDHFDHMYSLLSERNKRYLNLRQNFVQKISLNNRDFDILETAYIGTLITGNDQMDWFNPNFRDQKINKKWADICVFANNLL
jgi:hypothetical protein